jgi:hypothetical protein
MTKEALGNQRFSFARFPDAYGYMETLGVSDPAHLPRILVVRCKI